MSRVLLVLALLAAFVLFLLGFEIVTAEGKLGLPVGWLGLTLGLWIGSELVP